MAYSNVPGGEQSLDQITLEQFVRSFVYLAGDAFGRMRVSQLVAIGDYKFTKDLLPLKCGTRLTAGGTVTHDGNRPQAILSVTNAGDEALIRTYLHHTYRAAQSQLIRFTGILGLPTAGIQVDFGYFSDLDGLMFRVAPTGPQLVVGSYVTGVYQETVIPQADWNSDTLDGTGPSQKNPSGMALDLSKGQVFVIDLQFLGQGETRFGFEMDGVPIWVHCIKRSNVEVLPYMRSGSQPLTWRIKALPGYAGGLRQAFATCGSVGREGSENEPSASAAVSTGTTAKAVTTAGSAGEVHLLLRKKAGYDHAALLIKEITALNTGNAPFRYEIVLKPTLGGAAPVWSSIVDGGIGEVSTTEGITATGGHVIGAGYIEANAGSGTRGVTATEALVETIPVTQAIDGTPDVVAVRLHQISGATTALLALTYAIQQ